MSVPFVQSLARIIPFRNLGGVPAAYRTHLGIISELKLNMVIADHVKEREAGGNVVLRRVVIVPFGAVS